MTNQNQKKEDSALRREVSGILVRPMVATDADLVSAMHQRLSPESIYYRRQMILLRRADSPSIRSA